MQEADTTHEWGKKEILALLSHNKKPITPVPAIPLTPIAPQTLDVLAEEAATQIDANVIEALVKSFESAGRLPPDVDRPLIGRAGKTFGRLDPKQLTELRMAFVAAMKRRLTAKPNTGEAQS
jgi:hypothetical protein